MKAKKILIVGHKQHGKDELANILARAFNYSFISSSIFCLERAVLPRLTAAGIFYPNLKAAYDDRDSHRELWYEAIRDYNSPDKARLAKELLALHDIYVGLRDDEEYAAAKSLFDLIFWVHRPGFPLESRKSMKIEYNPAEMIPIVNAGGLYLMEQQVAKVFQRRAA